jgi:hypothetical protein
MNQHHSNKGIYSLAMLALLFSACTSSRYAPNKLNKEYNYFQKGFDSAQQIKYTPLTIKPNDLLNIQVSSNTLFRDKLPCLMQPILKELLG